MCCKILIGAAFKNSYTISKHCLTESMPVILGSNKWVFRHRPGTTDRKLIRISKIWGFPLSNCWAPGHTIAFVMLVYWVVTITMKFQWLLSLCAMKSWRQRRMLSFLNIRWLQGWMYQGCSVHSLATLKSKQWKSINTGPFNNVFSSQQRQSNF